MPTKHVFLYKGKVVEQVLDYDPVRNNPDGKYKAVEVEKFNDPIANDFDEKTGKWIENPEQKEKRDLQARAANVTWEQLVARVEALEAKGKNDG